MSQVVDKPTEEQKYSEGNETNMLHVVCLCNENLSLCGKTLIGGFMGDDWWQCECVVCADIADSNNICPRCGEPWTNI